MKSNTLVRGIKNAASYIFPLNIESLSSAYNTFLEISLANGKYLLNSENSNYSFGSLHTIFERTFHEIRINERHISNCLLLGLGGGSVVNILRKKYELQIPITAVEIDPAVIQLGKKYFDLNGYTNLTIFNEDAFNYVKNCEKLYDLIIVDVYINNEVPRIFHTREFVFALKDISHRNTIVLFNKMLGTGNNDKQYTNLIYEMTGAFGTVSFLSYKINNAENKMICVNTNRVPYTQQKNNESTPENI